MLSRKASCQFRRKKKCHQNVSSSSLSTFFFLPKHQQIFQVILYQVVDGLQNAWKIDGSTGILNNVELW